MSNSMPSPDSMPGFADLDREDQDMIRGAFEPGYLMQDEMEKLNPDYVEGAIELNDQVMAGQVAPAEQGVYVGNQAGIRAVGSSKAVENIVSNKPEAPKARKAVAAVVSKKSLPKRRSRPSRAVLVVSESDMEVEQEEESNDNPVMQAGPSKASLEGLAGTRFKLTILPFLHFDSTQPKLTPPPATIVIAVSWSCVICE